MKTRKQAIKKHSLKQVFLCFFLTLTLISTLFIPQTLHAANSYKKPQEEIYRHLEVSDEELEFIRSGLLTAKLVEVDDAEAFMELERFEQLARLYRGLYLDASIYQDRNRVYLTGLQKDEDSLSNVQVVELLDQLTYLVDSEYLLELALRNDLMDDLYDPSFEQIEEEAERQEKLRDEAMALRGSIRVHIKDMIEAPATRQYQRLGEVENLLQDVYADLLMNLRPHQVLGPVEKNVAAPLDVIKQFGTLHALEAWADFLPNNLARDLLANAKAYPDLAFSENEWTVGAFDEEGRQIFVKLRGDVVTDLVLLVPADETIETWVKETLAWETSFPQLKDTDVMILETLYEGTIKAPSGEEAPLELSRLTTPTHDALWFVFRQ